MKSKDFLLRIVWRQVAQTLNHIEQHLNDLEQQIKQITNRRLTTEQLNDETTEWRNDKTTTNIYPAAVLSEAKGVKRREPAEGITETLRDFKRHVNDAFLIDATN